MGEETKDKKKAPKRSPLNGETIWFALPALAIVVFFGWVLMEMGSAGGGRRSSSCCSASPPPCSAAGSSSCC
jgi:hypothetical protein